jgi:hypothetical protein
MARCTVLLNTKTRDELKAIARKNQTYDDIITELITERKKNGKN